MSEGTFTAAGIDALAESTPIHDRLKEEAATSPTTALRVPRSSKWQRLLVFLGMRDD